MLTIIAAIGKNNELGKKGGLCFRLPSDLKLFKQYTMGKKIFMGLTTFKSLPKRLDGREYFVLTHDKQDVPDWATAVTDLESFLANWSESSEEMVVIGGGSVYKQCFPYCDKLVLTEIEATDEEADTFFPTFSRATWLTKTLVSGEENGLKFEQKEYTQLK